MISAGCVGILELADSPRVALVDFYDALGPQKVIWWILEDTKKRRSVVCLDCRQGSSSRYRLIEGVNHPRAGGRVLELGDPEEGVAISALSEWLQSRPLMTAQDEILFDFVSEALLLLGRE